MDDLFWVLVSSTLYSVAISGGIGRDMDDHIVTRPLVISAGIFMVIAVKEWGNWPVVVEWLIWFCVAGIPQTIRVAVIYLREEKKAKLRTLGINEKDRDTHATASRMADQS